MTREEAIVELHNCIELIWQDGQDYLDERDLPLLDMAIEALERDVVECWECKFSGRENKDDELLLCTQGWIPKLVLETDYCGKGRRRRDD